MHSTVLHKRSTIPGNAPDSTILSAGEIALNLADGKMFVKSTDNSVKTFLNEQHLPYTFDQSLSSVNYQQGSNLVTGILGGVLGGIGNSVSGAGSTAINGSDNSIAADYAIIGNGSDNEITAQGDYGAILGGHNNTLSHPESFILGSNISSHLSGFTYVNNLSSTGKIYANGVELNGAGSGVDTEVRSLTSSWLPLSGGTITGNLSVLGTSTIDGVAQLGNIENAVSTIYVDTSKVGINTETPNKELTVEALNDDYDIAILTPRSPTHKPLYMASVWHGRAWLEAIKDLKKFIKIPQEVKHSIYENHFVARGEIYKDYVSTCLLPVMDYMSTRPIYFAPSGYAKKKSPQEVEEYRKKTGHIDWPIAPFVLERLFSIWIDSQKFKVINK